MKHTYNLPIQKIPLSIFGAVVFLVLFYALGTRSFQSKTLLRSTQEISVCGVPSSGTSQVVLLQNQDSDFVFADTGRIHWGISGYPQPVPNSEAQTALVNGKLYSFGGFDKQKGCCTPTDRAYVFSPDSGWSAIKSMPPMNDTGHGGVTHAGFTTDGTDIYFGGGYTSDNSGNRQIFGTVEVWKYSVAADDYSRMPDLPEPFSAGEMEFINGKLYFMAGSNLARTEDLGTTYVLDLADTSAGWTALSPMPNPRNHVGSAVYDGKLFIFGGQHGHDNKLITQNAVHCYDPETDTWTEKASMPKALSHITGATFTYGDQIFVMGGEQANGPEYYVSDVIAYNPITDNWSMYPGMPSKRTSGVANIIGDSIYYSTGYGTTTTFVGKMLEFAVPEDTTQVESCEPEGIWIEAECADIAGESWLQQSIDNASGTGLMAVAAGNNQLTEASDARAATLGYSFTVDSANTYHIYGRVLAVAGNQDSFWARLDSGAWQQWTVPVADSLNWSQMGAYALDAGEHQLTIAYREGGTGLDKLLIAASECLPSGIGQEAQEPLCDISENQLPAASAGKDTTFVIAPAETEVAVTLDATNSEDTDGEIIAYQWLQEGEVVSTEAQWDTTFTAGTYIFVLQVEDSRGGIATDSITIDIQEVAQENIPPVAQAGQDTTIYTPNDSATVTLDGSASQDEDGDIAAYVWTLASDTLATEAMADVLLPLGEHRIILTVIDNQGVSDTASIKVTIEEEVVLEIVHGAWLEGECADSIGSHWTTVVDQEASNDQFLSLVSNTRYEQSEEDFSPADIATYQFSVDVTDTFYLFLKAQSLQPASSQVWAQVNQGSWTPLSDELSGTFDWQLLSGNEIVLDSNQTYSLKIAAQGKVDLDKMYLGNQKVMLGIEDVVEACTSSPITVVVGIDEEPEQSSDIGIYPNPGRGLYTVSLPEHTTSFSGHILVSTVEGKTLKRLPVMVNSSGQAILDLREVPAGVYLMQVRIKDQLWVKRIEKL